MITFLEKVKDSLLDNSFGAKIKTEKLGESMKYLVIWMLFIGSVIMIKGEFEMHAGMKEFISALKTDIPDFALRDGHFTCQGEMPFIKKTDKNILVIDTSGKTSPAILEGYKTGVLITGSTIVYKKNTMESTNYNLSDLKKLNVTKADLVGYANNLMIPGIILIFIIGVICIYLFKLIGVLFLSLLAFILSKIIKTEIDFKNLFKIGIYAIIIPSLLTFCLYLFNINIPYFWIVYYAIAIFFIAKFIIGFNGEISEEITSDNELK